MSLVESRSTSARGSVADIKVVDTAPGLRGLADPVLQASLEKVLATIPADHIGATVDVGADQQGIQAVGVIRLRKGWSVGGVYDRRFSGEWSGHVQVRWSGR